MTLKVFTAFSGYDSQCMALDRMKIDYELAGWSEIDKYAIMAHNAIYPQYKDRNFGDISKIDWENVPDFDLFTYSFPCTDISSAGQQKGLEEGSGTRSGLLWECKKAIELKRPKYLLTENVKALTHKKFLPYLHKWHSFLTEMGYTNFTQILNSKNFGVPQNRERVFMVSILGDAWFDFPKPFQSDKKLKDLLDENVDNRLFYKSGRLYMEKNIRISAVVGIDPGSNGGIVTWRPNQNIKAIQMPKDLTDLRNYLEYLKTICSPIVFLEKLSVRPDDVTPGADGVNMGKLYRIQKMMANFEQLKAIISVCDIPFVMVHPMKWQNELKLRAKTTRKKEEKNERKRRYKEVAGNLYPELKPTLWNADATLIMHFGRYILRNNPGWVRQNLPSNMHERLF